MATGQGETDPCPTAVGTQVVSSASSAVAQSELLNLLKQRLPESAGGPSSQDSPALPSAGPMQGPLQGWGGGCSGLKPGPRPPYYFSSARSTAGHRPGAWTDRGTGPGLAALRQCPARVWSAGCCLAPCLCPRPQKGQGCACGADFVSTPLGRRQYLGVNSPLIKVPNCPVRGWVRGVLGVGVELGNILPYTMLTLPLPPGTEGVSTPRAPWPP